MPVKAKRQGLQVKDGSGRNMPEIKNNIRGGNKISEIASDILEKEFPMLKGNMLFQDLLFYSLYKHDAVQKFKNSL